MDTAGYKHNDEIPVPGSRYGEVLIVDEVWEDRLICRYLGDWEHLFEVPNLQERFDKVLAIEAEIANM